MSERSNERPNGQPEIAAYWRRWLTWLLRLLWVWAVFVVAFAALSGVGERWFSELLTGPPRTTPRADLSNVRSLPCATAATPADLASAPPVVSREVRIDLREGRRLIERTAWLHRCGPALALLVEAMGKDGDEPGRTAVIAAVFGRIHIDGPSPRFEWPAIQEQGPSSDFTKVVDRSVGPVPSSQSEVRPGPVTVRADLWEWLSGEDRVILQFDPTTAAWPAHRPPESQGPSQAVWRFHGQGERDVSVRIFSQASSPGEKEAETSEGGSQRLQQPLLFRGLTGRLDALQPVWLGITVAVPFFAVLWWSTRRRLASPDDQDIVDAAKRGCIAALGLIGLLMLGDTLRRFDPLDSEVFAKHIGLYNVSWTASIGQAALLGIIWPLFGARSSWMADRHAGTVLAIFSAALLAVCGALLWSANIRLNDILQLEGRPDVLKPWLGRLHSWGGFEVVGDELGAARWVGLTLGSSLLVAVIASAWAVARALAGRGLRLMLALVLVLCVLRVVERVVPSPSGWALAAALAVPFGWAFVRCSFAWCPTGSAPQRDSTWRWLTVSIVVFTALMTVPSDLSRNWSFPSLLSLSAWALSRFWQWAAIALLLLWLARPARSDQSPDDRREAGTVLLFIFLYWRAQLPWIPLLVAAAAGIALIRLWVFAPRTLREPGLRRSRLLGKAMTTMRTHNRLVRLRRGLSKGLGAKVDKGESTDATEVLGKLHDMDGLVDQHEVRATRQRCVAMLALNAGPGGTPWGRARSGALIAVIASSPWIVGYVAGVEWANATTNAGVVSRFGTLTFDVAQWPMLGFFFLYFYPQLRGSNGIRKGLCMTVAVVVPMLLAKVTMAGASLEEWRADLFWALQAFIVCMTIGVFAGDFGALRRVGKSSSSIVEIYNLGTLAAWSSSLLLAIGVAGSTALASSAGALFSEGLKMIPQLMQGDDQERGGQRVRNKEPK